MYKLFLAVGKVLLEKIDDSVEAIQEEYSTCDQERKTGECQKANNDLDEDNASAAALPNTGASKLPTLYGKRAT